MTFNGVMMNFVSMYRFVITLFLFYTISSCTRSDSGITTVSGLLIHGVVKPGNKVYFYSDSGGFDFLHPDKTLTDSCEINPDGFYSFKITGWHRAGFFNLGYNHQIIARNYFLQPGEKIQIDLDISESPARLLSHKKAGKYNQFLQEFSDTFYRNPVVKNYYYISSNFLLAPEFAKYIDDRHLNQQQFAKRILDDPETTPVFKNYLQSEIDYQWANDKTAFLWKKWIRNEEVPLDSSYFNYVKEIRIDNPDALISPAYIRFLQLYIRELYRQLPLEIQSASSAPAMKCQIAAKYTSGIAYKVALYHILSDELSNVSSLGVKDQKKWNAVLDLASSMVSLTGDSVYLTYAKNY